MAEQEQQSDAYYTDLLSRVDDCVAETREAGHTDNVGHVGGSGVQCIARTSTIAAEALLSVVLLVPSAAVRANLYISTCRVCVSTPRLGATPSHDHLAMSYMLSRLRLSTACARSHPSSTLLLLPCTPHTIVPSTRQNSLVAFVGNEHSVTGATCLRDPTDS